MKDPVLGFPGGSVVKESACSAGDTEDAGSIPGSARSPGGGHGNPLQYSCLKNPMDRNLIALNQIDIKMYIVRELTTRWRVEYDGQMYNVLSKAQAERQPIMTLRAERIME